MFVKYGKRADIIEVSKKSKNRHVLLQARFNDSNEDDVDVLNFIEEIGEWGEELTVKDFVRECIIERRRAVIGGNPIEFRQREEVLKSEVVDMVRSLNARNKELDSKMQALWGLIETAEEVVQVANETVRLIEAGKIAGPSQGNLLKKVTDKFTTAKKQAELDYGKYGGQSMFAEDDDDEDDDWLDD